MPGKHEPDPDFLNNLEWQLKGELRRQNRMGIRERVSVRVLKIAALMVASIGLGAGAMEATQRIQESWRTELLEARLEVQLELARQRAEMQREALEQTREEVDQGLQHAREVLYAQFQIARAMSELEIVELELEEIRESGREPLGELSSPLVGGRDFVAEKMAIRMEMAQLYLSTIQRDVDRTEAQVAAGAANERELQEQQLVMREAELQLHVLGRQRDMRQAYLDGEISAVEAELRYLEADIERQTVLLAEQRQYYQGELDRIRELTAAGIVRSAELAQVEMRIAEIDGQSRLAEKELEIVQQELRRRRER